MQRPDKQRPRPAVRSGSKSIAASDKPDSTRRTDLPWSSSPRRGPIIEHVFEIQLWRLDRAKPAPPGAWARVNIGDTLNVTSAQAWILRGLLAGAGRVEILGSAESQVGYLEAFLAAHPDVEGGEAS